LDHFARLGLAPRFRLDVVDLERRFRRFQSAVHPDRFATGSAVDRRLALKLAADGNEAYRILRHPTRRAAYLCELRGAEVGAQTDTSLPTAFLEEQMVLRERLDQIAGLDDGDPRRTLVRQFGADLDEKAAASRERVAQWLDDRNDAAAAAAEVRELMFYDKLREELERIGNRRDR
jgi:molecular chaperone HscB